MTPKKQKCRICKAIKKIEEFPYIKRLNRVDTKCKQCRYTYFKKYVITNSDKIKSLKAKHNKNAKVRRTDFIRSLKEGKPCIDCGFVGHPCQMDFDHVRGKKRFTISSTVHSISYKDLLTEILKCDVVCANCHRLRTFNENKIKSARRTKLAKVAMTGSKTVIRKVRPATFVKT